VLSHRILVSVLLVLALGGGVAAASVIVPQGDDTQGGPESVQPDGGAVVVGAITSNPGGGPDWAVRTYTSLTGLTCPSAGRWADGEFGRADAQGAGVVPLPVSASGSCADLESSDLALAVRRYPQRPGQEERGVVFGVVSGRVREVRLLGGQDDERVLPLDGGAFLAVGEDMRMAGITLQVARVDGSTRRYALDGQADGR
jgi:hypothetical protein